MRIFYSFLIILGTTILFLLPATEGIYDYRTDVRTDTFNITTAAGVTAANVTLHRPIFDADTNTLSYFSDNTADSPAFSDYDSVTRRLEVSGLAADDTRELDVLYDIDALAASLAINNFLNVLPFIWIIIIVAFPAAALAAVLMGRAR